MLRCGKAASNCQLTAAVEAPSPLAAVPVPSAGERVHSALHAVANLAAKPACSSKAQAASERMLFQAESHSWQSGEERALIRIFYNNSG